jgi:hypothetical protein
METPTPQPAPQPPHDPQPAPIGDPPPPRPVDLATAHVGSDAIFGRRLTASRHERLTIVPRSLKFTA